MTTRAMRITLLLLPTLLLLFIVTESRVAASPTAQDDAVDYQIVISMTAGISDNVCADTTPITVPYNQAVYYCVSVQNTGNLTLTRHTVDAEDLGRHTFEAPLPPGATLNTVDQGVLMSTNAVFTATNVVTWTAQPYGYSEATATASATVYTTSPVERITVTTTDDELNNDGDCSLREAIIAANTDSVVDACPSGYGKDTIFVPAGTYNMSLGDDAPHYQSFAPPDDASATGDFDLLTSMVIRGEGEDKTILDGPRHDRVFHVLPTATVTVTGLTVRGGHNIEQGGGGGFRNSGDLTIQDATVAGNTAGDDMVYSYSGGGIWNNGTLTLVRATVRGNRAGSYYISHYWYTNSGGGIYNLGTLSVTHSRIVENQGGDGGGLVNYGIASLDESEVLGNEAYGEGGGVHNGGSLRIDNTTIEHNTSDCQEPYECARGAAGLYNSGILTVERSRIGRNRAANVVDGKGGGLHNLGSLTLVQSAVYSNTATGRRPGGGGMSNHLEGVMHFERVNERNAAP